MPAMSQNPPKGTALKPYSVWPFFFDHSVGPKPMKYRRTRMPKLRAATMCPASCSAMDAAIPTAKRRTPIA